MPLDSKISKSKDEKTCDQAQQKLITIHRLKSTLDRLTFGELTIPITTLP